MTIHVTSHAIERYQERVANVPEDEARAALSTTTFETALQLGASAVKLPSGHRAVIEDGCVITVHPKVSRSPRRHAHERED